MLGSLLAGLLLLGQTLAVVTSGATGNGVQVRLEIADLINDKTSWNIYLLALQQMQQASQSDQLSWYQLAGIHGRPQQSYDGVKGTASPQGPGYCTHVSNFFCTWHRPYMALYEQVLVSTAISVAQSFPAGANHDKYLAAAQKLRAPFWDWAKARSSSAFPSALTSPTATVTTPTGSQKINNPLYLYNFHPNPGNLYYQPFTYWNSTLRWPTSDSDENASSQQNLARSNVESWQPTLHDRLYTVLTQYPDYNQFSNEAWITDSNSQDSLESIHDVIHGAVGGTNYGHMSIIDVSAFDPVFFLHHCMVDRAFALWQAINPSSTFEQQTQSQGTYWYDSGYVSKINTPLKPFHQTSSGTFWTSQTVWDWTQFEYTYPELQSGWTASSVKTAVNKLYGSSTSTSSKKRSVFPGFSDISDLWKGHPLKNLRSRFPGAMPSPAISLAGTSSSVREYMINIRAQKNVLGQSYFIFFFLGEAPENSVEWGTASNLVGVNPVISLNMPQDEAAQKTPVLIGSAVPLNRALVKKHDSGELKSLSDDDVSAYLQKNLSWQVKASNGTILDASNIPNLLVSVASSEIEPATADDDFPKRKGAMSIHTAVTSGKGAGLCESELHLYKTG
ncbi:Di-copper centre-containing protein [Rhizodiscina lignyota]|uniref:tyrosinase n=1 Tax=Rhizodiscina lignyota TaxID=1504668 RepID=A0A9P4M8Q7_9PEZI|nr:Di-copper centre-containing protein [Rhizodiscina lignyota]